MSIAEFTGAMKEKALKSFRNANIGEGKHINPLYYVLSNNPAIRSHEQSKSRTSFIITKSTIQQVRDLLVNDFPDLPTVDTMFQNLQSIIPKDVTANSSLVNNITRSNGDTETYILFKEITFGQGIADVVEKMLGGDIVAKNWVVGGQGLFQRGHVVGIPTNLLERSRDNIKYGSEDTKTANTLKAIGALINDLKKADIESSNFGIVQDYDLVGNYTKDPKHYLVELQLTSTNRGSGDRVREALSSLRPLLTSNDESLSNIFFKDILKSNTLFQSLITMRGSPSMLDMIEASLLEALSPETNPKTNKYYSVQGAHIARFTNKINVDNSRLRRSIQKEIDKLQKLKIKITKDAQKKTRDQKGRFVSLVNLQILLNTRLADQIAKNMGSGERRDILNYRTGRFSGSVSVKSLVLTKEDSINIFYTYMKYPYATFAPGGIQQSPKSRDPNILISKSIREIATELVSNRLKVIPV
jgi:hypothetical protein